MLVDHQRDLDSTAMPTIPATPEADLIVGTTYRGATAEIGSEPISVLLPCGNMGGFRINGSVEQETVRVVALVTTFGETDWPDRLEPETGRFIYYGDNRQPGRDLHATPRHGNELLRWVFAAIHIADHRRDRVPPFFVFRKGGPSRAVTFLGVAAPGAAGCTETEDLVAIWTTRGNERFQNYRAVFTLLDVPVVERAWIEDACGGEWNGPTAPPAWREWVDRGHYGVLSPRTNSFGAD